MASFVLEVMESGVSALFSVEKLESPFFCRERCCYILDDILSTLLRQMIKSSSIKAFIQVLVAAQWSQRLRTFRTYLQEIFKKWCSFCIHEPRLTRGNLFGICNWTEIVAKNISKGHDTSQYLNWTWLHVIHLCLICHYTKLDNYCHWQQFLNAQLQALFWKSFKWH